MPLRPAAVEVEQAGAGLAVVPGDRRQQRAGRASRCRPSPAVAAPGRARAAPGPRRRCAPPPRSTPPARRCGPRPRRGVQGAMAGSSSSPAHGVGVEEGAVGEPVANQDVNHREGQRGIACRGKAGGGCRPARRWGGAPGRRRSPSPAPPSASACAGGGAEAEGFAPQTRMLCASRAVRGSKPITEGADRVVERNVAGHVAHGVGLHLAGAEAAEEAHREGVGDQRAGAGIVGVHDPLGAVTCGDRLETRSDIPRWRPPKRPARSALRPWHRRASAA